jgi:hypothetical protein
MKPNIYDWSDEYDRIATAIIKFLMEHVSIHSMADVTLPMEVHRARVVGKFQQDI